jgi:hypothetical protein
MTPTQKPEAEVDFIHLARTIWDGRILMGKLILVSVVIGFFVAILIPNQFTASSTMVPQITDPKASLGGLSSMSGLSGLAAMAGVNINTGAGSELSPRTYSSIIGSVPFQLELMKTRLNFERLDTSVTLYDYYTKIKFGNPLVKFTVGLPHLIIMAIKGERNNRFSTSTANPLYSLTEKQIEVQRIIESQVGIFINEKDGFVTINCTLPEAYSSAQLAHSTQLLLQKYITEFKIEKAKVNLDFIQQRYDEARKNYQTAQQQLATFRDRNRNVSTAVAKTEEERLTAEYTLVTGVYSELAKKLEQAKITVKEETPVFTIINPVSVPSEKSSPNRPLILAIAGFIGFVLSFILILGKDFMVEIVTKWRKNDQ